MSNAEIAYWVAAALVEAQHDFEADEAYDNSPRVPPEQLSDEENWTAFLDMAKRSLLTSKTKVRTGFLNEKLFPVVARGDISTWQIREILGILALTYPRYADTSSRNAVLVAFREMIKRDALRGKPQGELDIPSLGVSDQVIKWMESEASHIVSSRSSTAPGNQFALLTWCCVLYDVESTHNTTFSSSANWKPVLGLLSSLLDSLSSDRLHVKLSLRKGAISHVKRVLRSHPGQISTVLATSLEISTASASPVTHAAFIGLVCDVAISIATPSTERTTGTYGIEESKTGVLGFYTFSLLLAKSPIPRHSSVAFAEFIRIFLSAQDLQEIIIPTAEKALIRSPEISIAPLVVLFECYQGSLSQEAFSKLLAPVLSCAKSTSQITRTNAVALFGAMAPRLADSSLEYSVAMELLALPKAGKTAGPDHRTTLYQMLSCIKPRPELSPPMVPLLSSLLAKEVNDGAIAPLQATVSAHLLQMVREGSLIPPDAASTISAGMTSAKISLRRAFCSVVGELFWSLRSNSKVSPGSLGVVEAFARVIAPSLDQILKSLGSPATPGPLEGYLAVSVIINWMTIAAFKELVTKNSTLQLLRTAATKPSFVFTDKVYTKLADEYEELWLIRAAEVSILYLVEDLRASTSLRTLVGNLLLHLAVNLRSANNRKEALLSIRKLCDSEPRLLHQVVRETAWNFLSSPTEQLSQAIKQARFNSLLSTISTFQEGVTASLREELVTELILIAHHYEASPDPRQCWIELVQKAKLDPHELVVKSLDRLISILRDAASGPAIFADSAKQATTTVAFIAPDIAITPLVNQIEQDLDLSQLASIGPTEIEIYNTPEGTLFVDVLASKREGQPASIQKGKDQDIEKWEAELRKTLASKKKPTAALSKQDEQLVKSQLSKEAEIRETVKTIKNNFLRGFSFIQALAAAEVEQFRHFVGTLVKILLGGVLDRITPLVEHMAFQTYLDLGKCCVPQLGSFVTWVSIATLRSFDVPVPEAMAEENLCSLVLRVLYRLRTLSEQRPLDPATFSYISPLLMFIINNNGAGTTDVDAVLEQASLALNIIGFHSEECRDPAYPRLDSVQGLIEAISRYPKLSKDASSVLIGLGRSICQSATHKETEVILRSTLAQEGYVRNACLQTLQPFDLADLGWSPELWLACHDEDSQNARLALQLWEENDFEVPLAFGDDFRLYLGHDNRNVRTASSSALASAVRIIPPSFNNILDMLTEMYKKNTKNLAPEYDRFGMLVEQSLNQQDPWQLRETTGKAFEKLAPFFTQESLTPFFEFLVTGEALGDRSEEVRRAMLDAGISVIDCQGHLELPSLISIFEGYLSRKDHSTEVSDRIQEAVIILLGRAGRHFEQSDPRVKGVLDRLIEALKTPSELVQSAVSDCLPALILLVPSETPELVERLLDDMFRGPKYAVRRGAAYGLAGIIKGTGLKGLKAYNIIPSLRRAIDDKKQYESRQGALFALETLSATLGRLFEPYVIEILPLLLATFGDQTPDVREATQDASKVLMSHMSGFGVKMILPTLLDGLEDKQWRSKKGSIELLGTMAFCAPKQLSISLPTVIPRLTDVLTDSHVQVRSAANKSLKQFGEVITNPEIQNLAPTLLKALVDPEKTLAGLNALLKTSFVHFIDSPSLALVVPILERGLKERSAETKRKAAQIVGNLASLTEPKDFVAYLDRLMPLVHVVLVDPVPEARATAAKALGTLVERLGETTFPDLVFGLLRTLKGDTSAVDRQGAAQGLSEVLSGLGMERMEALLPDIIQNAQSTRPYVREGFMSLLVYLPATFGHRFTPYLGRIVQPVLDGLADMEELVRSAAMKAGRMIISQYSHKATDLLLPELERGMFDESWRIRHSSITLVGELLFKISGVSGKAEVGEDDDEAAADATAAESSRRALADVLGKERRDRVLASLYLARQDSVAAVRQACIHIWKALVHNTPRTVRDILPSLISKTLELLAGSGVEQTETAARTLGEICRKLGEKILGEMMPILRVGSSSPISHTREGVCLAIGEITQSTTESQREGHEGELVAIVRGCLVDESAEVRTAAASAFDILQESMGENAISSTIPTLLAALHQPGEGAETALRALKEITAIRATTVFPEVVPTLVSSPITLAHMHALSDLVTVAGHALSKRITQILNALVRPLETEPDIELRDDIRSAIQSVLRSVSDIEGLNTLMLLLLGWAKNEGPVRRATAVTLFGIFCETTTMDFSLYRIDWVRQLVTLLDDAQEQVFQAAWAALDSFTKSVDKNELEGLMIPLRRTIESTGAPGRSVPGFSLPKGISPLLPIILAALTAGTSDQKEQAAYAIGDLIERTDEAAIKPFITQLTGPLIRVITQATALPPPVKSAILTTLTIMLDMIPAFVKPFFPQLQRTFCKSAIDSSSIVVRTKAAAALGSLFKSQTRVDPLIAELVTGVRAQDEAIGASLTLALANVVKSAQNNVGTGSRESLVGLIEESFSIQHDEAFYSAVAQLYAALAFDPEMVKPLVSRHLVAGTPIHPLAGHMLATSVEQSPRVYYELDCVLPMVRQVVACINSDVPSISRPAREARETLRTQVPWVDDDSVQMVF